MRWPTRWVAARSEPARVALRYYLYEVYPGVTEAIVRRVLQDKNVGFIKPDPVPSADDQLWEVRITPELHQAVVVWRGKYRPDVALYEPRIAGEGTRLGNAGPAYGTGGGRE
jgi:hypothetical protein